MTIFHVIILGLVEGITEFLPISSTAHLSLVSSFFSIGDSVFVRTFEIVIQSGAMLALLVLFLRQTTIKLYWKKVIIAFIPTMIVGYIAHNFFKNAIGNLYIIAISLFLGGIIIIFSENFYRKSSNEKTKVLNNKNAFLLGLSQSLAVIPGVSRSGAMIVSGLFMNLDREMLTLFTFLLGAPTIFAASGYDLLKTGLLFTQQEYIFMSVGAVVSFLTAFFTAKWFLAYIREKSFKIFGWYRIFIAILILGSILF